MTISDRLVEIREKNGYTRKRLAEELGRPYATITKYETGERDPGHTYIVDVAEKFGVTTDYILGVPEKKRAAAWSCSEDALKIARDYDALDVQWKRMARILFEAVVTQARETQQSSAVNDENKIIHLPEPIQAASAGTGEFADDDTSEQVAVLYNKWTAKADYIMRVHGDSMEPQIHDGDRVLVREQPAVDLGETGVFIRGGERFVKIYRRNYLESANPAYPDVELDEDSHCIGKVIGVLDPSWIVGR